MKRFIRKTVSLLFVAVIAAQAHAINVTVDVFANANSSTGGAGVPTLLLAANQKFMVTANPGDLWNGGNLGFGWSNADGLQGANRLATGTDDSGEPFGTLIGVPPPTSLMVGAFEAPFGTLVGKIGTSYVRLGVSKMERAPEAGILHLFYWDNTKDDNTEKVEVLVQASDNGGLILSLIAFGLLGFYGRFRRSRNS